MQTTTFTPSAQKYVPKFRQNMEKSQAFKELEMINKNKKITEELAIKYLYERRREKLTPIQEQLGY